MSTKLFTINNIHVNKTVDEWELHIHTTNDKNSNVFWDIFPSERMGLSKKQTIDESNIFSIKADNIERLDEYLKPDKTLEYQIATKLMKDIGEQLVSLEMNSLGIPFIDLSDIIVIDYKGTINFFYMNSEKIYTFDNDHIMKIDIPHKKSDFMSPEMNAQNTIPMDIHYKSGIYSLGLLVGHCIFNKLLTDNDTLLKSIRNSVLYWTIRRMTHNMPSKRYFILI
jgi:hypothetical protein